MLYYTMYNYTPCFFCINMFFVLFTTINFLLIALYIYICIIFMYHLYTCTHTYTHTHKHTHKHTHNYMAKPLDLKNTKTFDRGYGYIVLEEVQCRGNESNLSECPHAGIKSNNCKVIGVICGKMTSTHM